ncbi:MAG: DUF86 domain-containing protein [Chloroflexi bacterium]|nr:DUF86 domain-containing protein [Chloroflexota bacterium]
MKDDKIYLIHIIECITRIQTYTKDGRNQFFGDVKTQDAVLRNLQTLAESSQRVSKSLKAQNPEVDWRAIGAFRNVLVHDYLSIDLQQVWDTVERDLPNLKIYIDRILQQS